jgi:hypothetical protein
MNKTAAFIVTVVVCLLLAGCNEQDDFKAELENIKAPDMSASILDLTESDQLAWLAVIGHFH